MSPSICWIFFAVTAQPATPKDVLIAYAKALETQNYKAIAGLVLGGKPEFDYSKLVRISPDFEWKPYKVRVQVRKIVYSENAARVSYDITYSSKKGVQSSLEDDAVTLILDSGSWKIRGKSGAVGWRHYIECYAYHFAHPEETLAQAIKYFEPTRNRTLPTIKLGMARAQFLSKVFEVPDRPPYNFPPFNGYSTSTFDQTTTIYWPVGKADELIFGISFAGPTYGYLTKWKLFEDRARRVWQVNVYKSKDQKLAKSGTLAKAMKIEWLPSKAPQEVISTLGDPRPYAAYIEEHFGDYFCWTILTDGSMRPVLKQTDDPYEILSRQNDAQAFRRGFFITPWEVALMEKSPPIKALK